MTHIRRAQRRSRSGNLAQVLVLFALCAVFIFGMLAIALDGSYGLVQSRRSQNAADLASLAATQQLTGMCDQGANPPAAQEIVAIIQTEITANGTNIDRNWGWEAAYIDSNQKFIGSTTGVWWNSYKYSGTGVDENATHWPTDTPGYYTVSGVYPPNGACGVVVKTQPNWTPYLAGVIGQSSMQATSVAAADNSPTTGPVAAIYSLNPYGPHAVLATSNGLFVVVGNVYVFSGVFGQPWTSAHYLPGTAQSCCFNGSQSKSAAWDFSDAIDEKGAGAMYIYGTVHSIYGQCQWADTTAQQYQIQDPGASKSSCASDGNYLFPMDWCYNTSTNGGSPGGALYNSNAGNVNNYPGDVPMDAYTVGQYSINLSSSTSAGPWKDQYPPNYSQCYNGSVKFYDDSIDPDLGYTGATQATDPLKPGTGAPSDPWWFTTAAKAGASSSWFAHDPWQNTFGWEGAYSSDSTLSGLGQEVVPTSSNECNAPPVNYAAAGSTADPSVIAGLVNSDSGSGQSNNAVFTGFANLGQNPSSSAIEFNAPTTSANGQQQLWYTEDPNLSSSAYKNQIEEPVEYQITTGSARGNYFELVPGFYTFPVTITGANTNPGLPTYVQFDDCSGSLDGTPDWSTGQGTKASFNPSASPASAYGLFHMLDGVMIDPSQADSQVVGFNIMITSLNAVSTAGNVPFCQGGSSNPYEPNAYSGVCNKSSTMVPEPGNGAPCVSRNVTFILQDGVGGGYCYNSVGKSVGLWGVLNAAQDGGNINNMPKVSGSTPPGEWPGEFSSGDGMNYSIDIGATGANSWVELSAPAYGLYANVLLWQDRCMSANFGLDANPGDQAMVLVKGLLYNPTIEGESSTYGCATASATGGPVGTSGALVDNAYPSYAPILAPMVFWGGGVPDYAGGTLQDGYSLSQPSDWACSGNACTGPAASSSNAGDVTIYGIALVDQFDTAGQTGVLIEGSTYNFPNGGSNSAHGIE